MDFSWDGPASSLARNKMKGNGTRKMHGAKYGKDAMGKVKDEKVKKDKKDKAKEAKVKTEKRETKAKQLKAEPAAALSAMKRFHSRALFGSLPLGDCIGGSGTLWCLVFESPVRIGGSGGLGNTGR